MALPSLSKALIASTPKEINMQSPAKQSHLDLHSFTLSSLCSLGHFNNSRVGTYQLTVIFIYGKETHWKDACSVETICNEIARYCLEISEGNILKVGVQTICDEIATYSMILC